MVIDQEKEGQEEKKEPAAASRPGAEEGDACRCKETSKMPPGQLLRLMMSDLAFWKKKGKG